MFPVLAYTILALSLFIGVAISICNPALVTENKFISTVTNVEILSILAVTTTVTLGVASILHFRLTEIVQRLNERFKDELDERTKKKIIRISDGFEQAQDHARNTSLSLIILFGTVFAVLMARSWVPEENQLVHALISVFCLVAFLGNVLSMIEIHSAVFRLRAMRSWM